MPVNFTKRYPVLYKCQHCGNSGFTVKDGHSNGRGGRTCPTCHFGTLIKMTWNGCAYH